MKSLKAYISNVDPQLLQHLTGKMGEFVQTFRDGNFLCEDAFIAQICSENQPRKYYDNLKHRTIKMLQALTIVSTSQGANEVKKKLDLCRKNFTIGQKFLEKGERYEGLRLIKQAYRIAIEHDFTHMACELSSVLYFHYVYYKRNQKMAAIYAEQVEKFADAYKIEKKAEYYMFQTIAQLQGLLETEYLIDAIEQLDALKGESIKYKTYKSMLYVLYGFNISDYDLVSRNCTQALKFFEGKKGVYTSHYLYFHINLAIAQMATKQYESADRTFKMAEKYVHLKSINEYIIRLYKTTNALHSGNYQVAYDLYRQNRKCKFEDVKQQFAIIEAYLCFLSCMKYLQLDRPFRIGKYLNETFKAQADKQGNNIAVLIAELLVYLARDKGKFIDRVEAINSYSYRHLKSKDTRRAKRFIKILCLMPRANFNPIALKRLASRQIQYLEEHPICMGDNVSIEIIPFEVLLNMIMVKLERKVA